MYWTVYNVCLMYCKFYGLQIKHSFSHKLITCNRVIYDSLRVMRVSTWVIQLIPGLHQAAVVHLGFLASVILCELGVQLKSSNFISQNSGTPEL